MRERFRRLVAVMFLAAFSPAVFADKFPRANYWQVDDLKPGMDGYGVTVLDGTKRQRFSVQILGIMKNYSPGQDMVLCRLSGLNLEKTGVIAGMSGSPVYVDDRLVGAVAFTWPFGTEPIGGITPFVQMVDYSNPRKRNIEWAASEPSFLLNGPVLAAAGATPPATTVPAAAGGQSLLPIQTPVVTTGLTVEAVEELAQRLAPLHMFPVQGGGANDRVRSEHANLKLEPGSAMAVGLVTGDVSMTAVGTVTAVIDDRVFGFGHPFSQIGDCDFPLMTAYVHTVIPRLTVSSKMGSALTTIGKVDADVSTGVAGWIGKKPDMIPVTIRVKNAESDVDQTFRCEMVRERSLVGSLTSSALGSCSALEGQAPVDLTVRFSGRVEVDGMAPLAFEDVFSGMRYSGTRGLMAVYSPLANLLTALSANPFREIRLKSIECTAELSSRRTSAELVTATVLRPVLKPGEKLDIVVRLRPYVPGQGARILESELHDVPVEMTLPADLPPGPYTASIGDALADFRGELSSRPHLGNPKDFDQLYRFLVMQLALKRTDLVARINVPTLGVAVDGVELPNLPAGIVDILKEDSSRRVTPIRDSLVQRKATTWVVEGLQTVRFQVVKEKDFYEN